MNRIIIDTDPGTDDAVALLAAAALGLPVDTVISTYGNVCHSKTHRNLVNLNGYLKLCENIIYGADAPLDGTGFTAEEAHGADGVGGVVLPEFADNSSRGDFAKELSDRILKLGTVDYISLGPLTNLAVVLERFPECRQRIKSLTVMGGGFNVSNIPHNAEFNIGCDPTAAKYVLESGLDITLVPLDVTHKICLSDSEIAYITDNADNPLAEIMRYNYKAAVAKNDGGALIHDATAVIAYAYPEAFSGETAEVKIDKYGALSFGGEGNIKVILGADRGFVVNKLKNSYDMLKTE